MAPKRTSQSKSGMPILGLLQNRTTLYAIFFIGIAYLFYLLLSFDFAAIFFIGIVGLVASFFSRNMIVVISVALISTFVAKASGVLGSAPDLSAIIGGSAPNAAIVVAATHGDGHPPAEIDMTTTTETVIYEPPVRMTEAVLPPVQIEYGYSLENPFSSFGGGRGCVNSEHYSCFNDEPSLPANTELEVIMVREGMQEGAESKLQRLKDKRNETKKEIKMDKKQAGTPPEKLEKDEKELKNVNKKITKEKTKEEKKTAKM
jgi:hypothetical protein